MRWINGKIWLLPLSACAALALGAAAVHAQGTVASIPETSLAQLESDFAALRLASYAVVALAGAVGLLVFFMIRRSFIPFATLAGAAVAAVMAIAGLAVAEATLLSAESAACTSARPEFPARASYDAVCPAAREGAADSFGLVTLYRKGFVSSEGGVKPIGSGVVAFLAYATALPFALLFYFFGRWLTLRLRLIK